MTVSDKVTIWLASQPDIVAELGYSDRQRVKEGEHIRVVSKHIAKIRRQIRFARVWAGIAGGILFLVGLWSWALEFGIVQSSSEAPLGSRSVGTLFVLGALAVMTLFRVEALQKRVALLDGARELDSFWEGNKQEP